MLGPVQRDASGQLLTVDYANHVPPVSATANGISYDANGAAVVNTAVVPVASYSGGLPFDENGSLIVTAANAQTGGPTRAEFDALKASVISDLNALRDAIMLTNASLDADAGVATTTYAANGNPPPLVTK